MKPGQATGVMKSRLGTLRRRALGSAIFRILRMPPGHRDYTVTQARVPMRDGVELLTDLYTPAFAVARTAGWTAHALEQAEHGRLIRPDSRYVGPPQRPLPAGV